MEIPVSLPSANRNEIVSRAVQATAALLPFDTIEQACSMLEEQYALQLATYVPLADRRDVVASIINSSLPSEAQDQISDATVIAVFADLLRASLVTLAVTWVEPEPEPEPPPPEPEPPLEP